MNPTIDARGLSCPQPVLLALEAMKKSARGPLTILVDTDTARENVRRAALSQGWQEAAVPESQGEYTLTLTRA